jgi:hypothetical protein
LIPSSPQFQDGSLLAEWSEKKKNDLSGGDFCWPLQGCQMVQIFSYQKSHLEQLGRPWNGNCWYFYVLSNILWPFDVFNGHVVSFSRFGMLYIARKNWQLPSVGHRPVPWAHRHTDYSPMKPFLFFKTFKNELTQQHNMY